MENRRITEGIVKSFKIDGKDEDLKYYEDVFDVYDFIRQKKFLILGYKGTGKTYFLKKVRKIKEEYNFKIINCNMEKFYLILNKLDRNKIKDIKKELDMIWKFMIFIEIFKKIKDEKMDGENRKSLRLINRFLQKNSFLLNLSSDKILNKIIEKQIETEVETDLIQKLFSIIRNKFTFKEQKNSIKAEYYDFLEDFEEKISSILQECSFGIGIFFDELDSKFEKGDENEKILLSLLEETKRLNYEYENLDIFVCLRTEIFELLNSPDLNKIKEDKSITFKWDRRTLLKVIKKRLGEDNKSDSEFIKKYFESNKKRINLKNNKKKIEIFKYILNKTRYRPRDVVAFFKYVFENNPEIPITNETLDKEYGYSNYLYQEIKNELSGFYDNRKIEDIFNKIKKFNKSAFIIKDFLKENRIDKKQKEFYLNFFKKLYDLGIINIVQIQNGHKENILNYNIDGSYSLDEKCFVAINYGLRNHLKLYNPDSNN